MIATDSPKERSAINLMPSAEFKRQTKTHQWLIEDILVAGEPAVIGGPQKSMKTSAMLDMAISLGTGTPFLNRFIVPAQKHVAVFSGESGQATLKNVALRICRSKERSLSKNCLVDWQFSLPRFEDSAVRKQLREAIRSEGIEVVFIDPLYLCMPSTVSATNLYEVGPALRNIARGCLDAGATPVIVHHTTKTATKPTREGFKPIELGDLAFAGIGEFTRQWVLLNRKFNFEPGSGHHELFLSAGGSAGHSGRWSLTIDEGKPDSDLTGGEWNVKVGY